MSVFSVLRPICYVLQKLLWKTKIIGKENVDKALTDGGIIICNHYATPDSIIIGTTFFKKDFHALVKEESFKKGFADKFLRSIGGIPVKRGEADIDAYKAVIRVLNDNKRLLIFPEGTRNKAGTKELAPFKNGVALFSIRSGKPIVPMLYWRMHKLFHKNYLIIGEAIDLKAEGFDRSTLNEATEFIRQRMLDLRAQVDEIAEGGKK
jgi:1-acyl-sn-glycerol-3-phosphate acyltransferase